MDTCARVCHSPTGYGLGVTLGTSAGTQEFSSVADADVVVVIGANPTDAHPVFGSRMKKRLREGANLIVIDPRATDLVKSPHIKADFHLQLKPGTNVAIINAMAHVVVTEGLVNQSYVREHCQPEEFANWVTFIVISAIHPRRSDITGVDPAMCVRPRASMPREGTPRFIMG